MKVSRYRTRFSRQNELATEVCSLPADTLPEQTYEYLVGYIQRNDKAIPLQAWRGPEGSRRLRVLEVLDNRHMKVARLSALRTGRLYQQGDTSGNLKNKNQLDATYYFIVLLIG